MRLRWLFGICGSYFLTLGCKGATANQPSASPAPSNAPENGVAPTASEASRRTPSDAFKRRWPFGNDVDFGAYLQRAPSNDSDALGLFGAIALRMAQSSLSPSQRECAEELLRGVREVAIGSKGADHVVVARFDEQAIEGRAFACMKEVLHWEPSEVRGTKAAIAKGDDVLAEVPGLLVFGNRQALARAEHAKGSPAWPQSLDLNRDQMLKVIARIPEEQTSVEAFIAAAPGKMRFELQAIFPSEAVAADMELRAQNGKKRLETSFAASPEIPSKAILNNVQMARDGSKMTLALELRGTPVEIVRDVGLVSAVGIHGVRKYLLSAKSAEARNVLGEIAKHHVYAWSSSPPGKRKLVSLPPVPKVVPHGNKYMSADSDWKAWAPIHFSLADPQYFQYEVAASKDGKRADVIARGDLNGDGKTSLYKLALRVDPKDGAIHVAPEFEEVDPEE